MRHTSPVIAASLLLVSFLLFSSCAQEENAAAPEASVSVPVATAAPTATPAPDSATPKPTPEPTPEIDRSAQWIYVDHPELTPVDYDSPALLPISDDMGQDYLDRITFLCDSPTYWLWPLGLLSGGDESTQVWTGPGGTMTLAYQSDYKILDPYDGVERPIREVVALHQPEMMIIALGINGISFMDEEYFTQEYTDLVADIREISPGTTLLLQSVYPITPAYRYWGSITNGMITECNSWILKIAEDTGCLYLDTFSVLLGEDGNAKPELMRSDGLHPNGDGLTLVLQYIRTHGAQPGAQRAISSPN